MSISTNITGDPRPQTDRETLFYYLRMAFPELQDDAMLIFTNKNPFYFSPDNRLDLKTYRYPAYKNHALGPENVIVEFTAGLQENKVVVLSHEISGIESAIWLYAPLQEP